MSLLPIISGREIIKALLKVGYQAVRQKGSHVRLRHAIKKPTTVPSHKTIGKGLLRKILRDTELSVEDLLKLLKK